MRNHPTDVRRAAHGMQPVNLSSREILEDAGCSPGMIDSLIARYAGVPTYSIYSAQPRDEGGLYLEYGGTQRRYWAVVDHAGKQTDGGGRW